MEPFCVSFFVFFPLCIFALLRRMFSGRCVFAFCQKCCFSLGFSTIFIYMHLAVSSFLAAFCHLNLLPFWVLGVVRIVLQIGAKKNFKFGSLSGPILAPFWLHFGSQNRTRNCVEFTSTFLPLSGALLGLRGVHFGSARGPLWALWSPPWPP